MNYKHFILAVAVSLISTTAFAKKVKDCPVTHDQLETALNNATGLTNGQFPLDMWGTVVTKNGIVCAVAKTGSELNHQWLASRVISAQKAYTSASLSNNSNSMVGTSVAFSSAGLYGAASPGGPLYGLQHSNPVDTKWAYSGKSKRFGTSRDPMIGRYIGGLNVFGGGVALFDGAGKVIGGLGVSGNTSCADNNIAWRVRGEFADLGIAQGAAFEFNVNYEGDDDGAEDGTYPGCGDDDGMTTGSNGVDSNGVDDTWDIIGPSGSAPISQFF